MGQKGELKPKEAPTRRSPMPDLCPGSQNRGDTLLDETSEANAVNFFRYEICFMHSFQVSLVSGVTRSL